MAIVKNILRLFVFVFIVGFATNCFCQETKSKKFYHEFGFILPVTGFYSLEYGSANTKPTIGFSSNLFISRISKKKLKLIFGFQFENIGYTKYPLVYSYAIFNHQGMGGYLSRYNFTYKSFRRIDGYNLLAGIQFPVKSVEIKIAVGTPIRLLERERKKYDNPNINYDHFNRHHEEMFWETTASFQAAYYFKNDRKIKTGILFHTSGYLFNNLYTAGFGVVFKM